MTRLRLVAAAFTVAGLLACMACREGGDPGPAAGRTPLTTPVLRETLVDSVTVPGEVTYGPATPIAARAGGVVTWLPGPDTVVERGDVILRADEQPVILLLGVVPMYREIGPGATGQDVRQLEENLQALGYQGFTVDSQYTASTEQAVRRWQRDLGLTQTGSVGVGEVIYAPTPLRVEEPLARLGASASGDVLSVTGITPMVGLTLPAGAAGWARPDVAVVVTAGGADVDGTVRQVSHSADGSTVAVIVSVADPTVLADPVEVDYVAGRRENVLTVPVAALLALDTGGYGLELTDGTILPVQVGMFAAGRVEVSGDGLAEGLAVRIPA